MKKLSLLLVLALMLFSFAGCAKDEPTAGGEAKTVTGTAEGFGGEVKVTVTVNGNDITAVEAVGEGETPGIGSEAIDKLPDLIVEADSTNVDGIAGATVTSDAIKAAVNNALGN
ncbi:FMN-binding protein [Sedimentibacter sp.]|uniref:FMN-binding protein n=1 Tax=Sedimentibacter sp. TaxID=1960295 RepID=UPI0028A6F4E0|nr:FMN-binding protein [Sedimentibacter sp.]